MCGIAGILDRRSSDDALLSAGGRMADTLTHRGPDDAGVWCENGTMLAHRRLAIIDLSPEGHQPMLSSSGRYALSYNGEIYNFMALRQKLEASGIRFRGTSDTEVLLEAISAWGLRTALEESNGMFALALWDREQGVLSLARDRLGEKPLYFAVAGHRVVFGSELKALRAAGVSAHVDRDALHDLLSFGYITASSSILEGVNKVGPGELVTVPADAPERWSRARYWAPTREAWDPTPDRASVIRRLDEHVREATRLRMVADVPVGAFLSGGIDSSLIVATMQELSSAPVRTFTVGFAEEAFDEAPFARAIADHLGTEHHELYVSPSDSLDVIPRLADIYDEPFADVSQIPTVLIATLARSEVTVCLSGDGGDELFGGYDRYGRALDIIRGLDRVPKPARSLLSHGLGAVGQRTARHLLAPAYRLVRGKPAPPDLRHKVLRLAQLLRTDGDRAVYDGLIRHWQRPQDVVIEAGAPRQYAGEVATVHGFTDWMMRADLDVYLPDDILVKVDRATMAVSLESRVPLLDPHLVDFALRLPSDLRRSADGGKQLLVDLLATKLPRSLFDRPKMGFGVPIDAWLRGPLRPWAEDLLSTATLEQEGYLSADVVRRHWEEHLSGERNWQYLLWDVLMFQAWLERWKRAPAA